MGFNAFIVLSSAIASAGGLLGITLPFFVYTGASTVLSFLLGPAGFGLLFMGFGGQSIWKANERILRERMLLAIVVMHAMIIESGKDKLKLPPNWSFFEKLNLLTKKKDGRNYRQRFYKSLGSICILKIYVNI